MVFNKAASSALMWFLLAIIFSALPTIDGAIAYVRPSSTVTCPDQPCLSFSDYAREKDQYFLDGTLFVFLSGMHQFNLQLQLKNVSNISLGPLEGAGSAQIHLSPKVNVTWLDSNNVTITGLDFFLSGQQMDDKSLFSALVFVSTSSFLSRLSFFGNASWQSTAIMTHSSVIEVSDVTVSSATSLFGAALVAFNSTMKFTGQNYFMNNTATRGGAMYIFQSFANFNGHAYFINNNATTSTFSDPALGGAIYCENSALSFSSSVLFQYNQVIAYFAYGGGIFQQNSTVMFDVQSNVAFIENSAMFFGGAISINRSELVILGKALYEKNFATSGGGALNGQHYSRILCNNSREGIIFQNNYVDYQNEKNSSGGAIFTNSSYLKLEGVLFERNVAGSGGAIASRDIYLHIFTCDFYNNTAMFEGSAVTFLGTFALFNGANNFQWNLANFGGTVSVKFANVTFSGENNFSNNNATYGPGSLYLRSVSRGVICGNLTFYRNYAIRGAGFNGIRSNLRICGNSSFIENSARISGGGMTFFWCNVNITGQISFLKNSAADSGSAVYIRDSSVMIIGRMNISGGTMISSLLTLEGSLGFLNCRVYLSGVLILENNTGDMGGAISARNSQIDVFGCIQCINNLAHTSGGALFARNSTVRLRNNSDCNLIFQTNSAAEKGGAIYAVDSTISLSGSQTFLSNSASQGGAIAVDSSSKLVLNQPLQARFVENNASVGGAVFYEDTFSSIQCTNPVSEDNNCFIELDSTSNIQLSFINNTATSAGTVIYGGNFDHCRLYMGGGISDNCGNRIGGNYSDKPIAMIKQISESVSVDSVTSNISSDPLQICFCENGIPYCYHKEIDTVRGKEFTLMAVIVGQNYGVVPSSVRTSLDNDIQISAAQRIQGIGKECTPISYRLSSSKNVTTLVLFPDGPCRDARISRREIIINFLPCPDGFTLDGSECICEDRLQKYTNSCNVDDNSILRDSNTFWMGAVYENETFGGLILHSGCPFDYCIDTPVLIAVDNLDNQCNHNHSGILCGSCANGYSITFGTLHCSPCSNAYLALILPFAFAGIALVAVLLLLNISVASGAINGLIFYANVIQVNRSIFFPPVTTNILTVFIAWLNLDLGIETCFFDGMNTYIFTWLQFVFPLYVWFLIGLIIVISRFSDKIARSLGKNPVTALATLLHLSYSKILRTIIVALSFTILEYPGNNHQVVWLYDGNMPYFQSASHIVLGTVAIVVLLLLFLPYTLLLLCGHWLQAYSDRWMFSWLNRIKPLMDAYHAPYKEESRYWTGLLLFVRCALFLTFAFNALGNVSGNLLAILSITAGLAILAWLRNRIYENIFNDFLEAAFLLNLCILAAGTYHVKEIGGNQAGLAYTSVGITFVLFVCIMLYHAYLRLCTSALWKKIPKTNSKRYCAFSNLKVVLLGHNKDNDDKDEVEDGKQDTQSMQWSTTTTTIELREPLLGDSI